VTFFGLISVPAQATATTDSYVVAATNTTQIQNLLRTESIVQVGSHPLNRFKLVRLVRDMPVEQTNGAIIFLPPLSVTYEFFEQRDENDAFGTSLAEFFAVRGYDVYGYSPRNVSIPAGACELGVVDCSVMADWDLQSQVDDVAFIRQQIELNNPGAKVVVGGISLGAILSIAVVNAAPEDYVGVFPWDEMIYTLDPESRERTTGYCADLEAQLAAGIIYDGFSHPMMRWATTNARLSPDGPNMIPIFPSFFTNKQALMAIFSVPAPGALSGPVPGMVLINGDFAEGRFYFASEERLYENASRFVDYFATALVRDISCGMAGIDLNHVDNLGSFTGSVFMIGAGHGYGYYMQDQLDLFGSTDKTLVIEPEFGHIDHFLHPNHRQYVELPILHWLQRIMK
jgi:pimeloyl-ACP methyl ester carboxylesterase